MKEWADALKGILDRLAQFLDVFDLSYFVGGTASVAAIWFWAYKTNSLINVEPPGWMLALLVPVWVYLAGMLSYSLGRWPRSGETPWGHLVRDRFDVHLRTSLACHHQDLGKLAATADQLPNEFRPTWQAYTRMWAELRLSPEHAASLTFLNRSWVRCATYDGLTGAAMIWAAVFISLTWCQGPPGPISHGSGTAGLALSILSGLLSWSEARRYLRSQISDVVASIAAIEASRERTKRGETNLRL